MNDSSVTKTTSTLLAKLRDSHDEVAWSEFDGRYRSILQSIAQRMGLSPNDAEEIVQETLVQFLRDYQRGHYDRSKGRLRVWIQGILRNRALDLMRRNRKSAADRGDSVLRNLEEEAPWEELWRAECRKRILDEAFRILKLQSGVQEDTIEAFRMNALEDVPAAEVAQRLGLSVQSVYLAKHRCAKKLKEIVDQLTSAYEVES